MLVLISVGSRHGSTREIGERLARELRSCGHTVEVKDAARVASLELYGAVVVGSAVYMGQWTPEARAFVDRFEAELAEKPIWSFSSGPLGNPPVPAEEPADHVSMRTRLAPRGDRVFAGQLVPGHLGFRERLIARAVRAPAGDYRDWSAIDSWAHAIAESLADGEPGRSGASPSGAWLLQEERLR